MQPEGLLEAALIALDKLGVEVRVQRLPDEAQVLGGVCRIQGRLTVFVSPRAPVADRLALVLDALRRSDHESIWLAPLLRDALRSGPAGQQPRDTRLESNS